MFFFLQWDYMKIENKLGFGLYIVYSGIIGFVDLFNGYFQSF